MKSFKFAFKGIFLAFSQRNFIIEFVCALLVLASFFFLSYTNTEKSILLLLIFAVLSAETINTAIEKAVDLACKEQNKLAGQAKDLAAGAVLLLAICSIIIACLIILPKIFQNYS